MFDDTNLYKLRIEESNDTERYFVSFFDQDKNLKEVEVVAHIADMLFKDFVRIERNLKRSDERNLEHSELTEYSLHQRTLHKPPALEDVVFLNLQKEVLWKAIEGLPKTQRRRLILYYFEGFTYEQIAVVEGCKKMAVKFSIDIAKEKIKNFFEK
ncbi:MAG: sigma factor-like helix-turn-helix DNA-binding protein [Longicatena sp.]